MNFINELEKKAASAGKTIVLCEGEDKRVVEAASKSLKTELQKLFFLEQKKRLSLLRQMLI